MKVKVKVTGMYAVADEAGRLITKPGILEMEKAEAGRLEARKIVEILGEAESETEEDFTQKRGDAENQGDETVESDFKSDQVSDQDAANQTGQILGSAPGGHPVPGTKEGLAPKHKDAKKNPKTNNQKP